MPVVEHTVDAGKSAKVPRTLEPTAESCSLVSTALLEAEHLPLSVRKMLSQLVPSSLAVPKDERHACQEQVVDMIKESLAVSRAEMERMLGQAETDVDVASAKVEHLRPALCAAKTDLENKCAQVAVWAELFEQDKCDLQKSKTVLVEAENTQSTKNAKAIEMEKTKDSVERAMAESGMWVTSPHVKQCEQAINGVARDLGLEDMLEVLPSAITKSSDDWSEVLQKFKADVSTRMADLDAEIRRIKFQAGSVSSAAAAVCEAQEKHEVSIWALQYAYNEQETSEAEEKVARSAFDSAVSEFDSVVSVRNARQDELVTFQEGPLEALCKLQERTVLPNLLHDSSEMDVDTSLLEPVLDGMVVQPNEMLTCEGDVSEKNVVMETEAASLVTAVAGA